MEEIIKHLKEEIELDKDTNNNPNFSDWSKEAGVLLTSNQAKQIIIFYETHLVSQGNNNAKN